MAPLSKPSPKPHHPKSSNANKKSHHRSGGGGRILITVNVLGSAGPIRFLVGEEEPAAAVIQTALKVYNREGRLPVLGADYRGFFLYCADADGALGHLEAIGSHGSRSFLLCKKVGDEVGEEGGFGGDDRLGRKGSGSWRSWIHKSLSFTISSH